MDAADMPEPTTAPVTAEGLRERIEAALRSTWDGQPTHMDDAIRIETDAVLAALAGDPGDLPARMAEALVATDAEWTVTRETEWKDFLAAAAMSVRWEAAVQLAAENAQLRARAEHAEGELSARRDHETRWETEKARADKAEACAKERGDLAARRQAELLHLRPEVERLRAERDDYRDRLRAVDGAYSRLDADRRDAEGARDRWKARGEQAEAERDALRETLAESDLGAQVLAQWETIAAADMDRDRLAGEVAALQRELEDAKIELTSRDLQLADERAHSKRAYEKLAGAEQTIARGLALCDDYATHHPDWRPLATQTAVVFRRALTGEGDKKWLEGLASVAAERDRLAGEVAELQNERDLLRETLGETDLGAQVLAQWEAIAAADTDRDRLEAEVAALQQRVQHLAAEAHRRKWVYEGTPAFSELHRIGNELLADLPARPDDPEEIRRLAESVEEKRP